MARPVPADLENALSANPAARASFGAMSSEQKDAWVAWIERPRFSPARRRRVAEAVLRIGGGAAVRETEPRDDWAVWLAGLALAAGLAAFLVWLTVYRDHDSHAAGTVPVPNIVGSSFESARLQLRRAQLGSVLVHAATATPKGIVANQMPRPGGSVPLGTRVTLVISTGPLLQASTTTQVTTTVATTTAGSPSP
jgi:hypothetical protein